jgi:hypothetical protein
MPISVAAGFAEPIASRRTAVGQTCAHRSAERLQPVVCRRSRQSAAGQGTATASAPMPIAATSSVVIMIVAVHCSLHALQVLCRNPKEIAMSIRSMLFAAAFALASLEAAHADGLRPIEAKSIDPGEVSGVAYDTVERDGFHVVTTLAQGVAGTPIRVVSVLAPGQSVVFSTPRQAGALEIARNGNSVLVRKAKAVSN